MKIVPAVVSLAQGVGLLLLHSVAFFAKSIRATTLERFIYKIGMKFSQLTGAHYSAEGFCHCLANTYLERGDAEIALSLLKKRIDSHPTSIGYAYLGLARFYAQTGQRELALVNFNKALNLETNSNWQASIQSDLANFKSGRVNPACTLRRKHWTGLQD